MLIAEEDREGQGPNEPTWICYVDFSNVQEGQKLKNVNQAVYISLI